MSRSDPVCPAPSVTVDDVLAAGTVSFVSEWEGTLYFTVNDITGGFADNMGCVIVWLKLHRGPIWTSRNPDDAIPSHTTLGQNSPNPFRDKTIIRFSIPSAGDVNLGIYNMQGQLVRTLVCEELQAGTHSVTWDGRDQNGSVASSGSYLYCVKQNEVTISEQLVHLN